MTKTLEKPIVTVSGKKSLFKSSLHQKLVQDLPQEGVEWRRRFDSGSKSVYIDVDFVDFDVDNVERASERSLQITLEDLNVGKFIEPDNSLDEVPYPKSEPEPEPEPEPIAEPVTVDAKASISHELTTDEKSTDYLDITIEHDLPEACQTSDHSKSDPNEPCATPKSEPNHQQSPRKPPCDIPNAFFNRKLLGRPTLHTYWADKSDFEDDNQKTQFDEWIGQVQASTCTEWAIIIIEERDFKAQLGTALFKSKLQSSASQSNISNSLSSMSYSSSTFLDRMKKGLSTMFQNSNSDRWLTLINQDRSSDTKAQESYANFVEKFRNLIVASFSKQLELFEEQLRVQREMRASEDWSFSSYFSMQEELAFAFEFLTLFDEALVQYDFLDALFTDYISSLQNKDKNQQNSSYEQWTSFKTWPGLCLDMNSDHSEVLRKKIVTRQGSLLEFRNYLFAKRCDLMFMQNQPWRVAASTGSFLQNCIREHELLNINVQPGALTCWSFTSALEVLQKCECYSCTSTMENYSFYTVDIWNNARQKLIEIGTLCHLMPDCEFGPDAEELIKTLIERLGPDPHNGVSYQSNDISPYARLKDALTGTEQFARHLVEISELTLGTYKHIGRKRHALLVGMHLAELYAARNEISRALPFLLDMEKALTVENWSILLRDVRKKIQNCKLDLSVNPADSTSDNGQKIGLE